MTRKVNYYETDKMGITHHSNYVRWMEEARIEFLENIGIDYKTMESIGIASPVLSVECTYIAPTTFGDEIEIEVKISSYTGVRLTFEYDMKNIRDNSAVCKAKSRHCFVNKNSKPVALAKELPEYDNVIKNMIHQ